MRPRLPLSAALVATVVLTAAPGATAAPLELWVSPRGEDRAAGTRAAPLRTLVRARDVMRAVRPRDGARVLVAGGTHRMRAPLVLDARDSGRPGAEIEDRAAPGSRPVLSGGLAVTGWVPHDRRRSIWRADVPRGTRSRQLYVDGRRAVRAAATRTRPGSSAARTGSAPRPARARGGAARPTSRRSTPCSGGSCAAASRACAATNW